MVVSCPPAEGMPWHQERETSRTCTRPASIGCARMAMISPARYRYIPTKCGNRLGKSSHQVRLGIKGSLYPPLITTKNAQSSSTISALSSAAGSPDPRCACDAGTGQPPALSTESSMKIGLWITACTQYYHCTSPVKKHREIWSMDPANRRSASQYA